MDLTQHTEKWKCYDGKIPGYNCIGCQRRNDCSKYDPPDPKDDDPHSPYYMDAMHDYGE